MCAWVTEGNSGSVHAHAGVGGLLAISWIIVGATCCLCSFSKALSWSRFPRATCSLAWLKGFPTKLGLDGVPNFTEPVLEASIGEVMSCVGLMRLFFGVSFFGVDWSGGNAD